MSLDLDADLYPDLDLSPDPDLDADLYPDLDLNPDPDLDPDPDLSWS